MWGSQFSAKHCLNKNNPCKVQNFNYLPGDDCYKKCFDDEIEMPPIYCADASQCQLFYFESSNTPDNPVIGVRHSVELKKTIGEI